MSNFEQLSAQQDWQEHYSQYLSQSEDTISSSHYEQAPGLDSADCSTQDPNLVSRPQLEHRNSFGILERQQDAVQTKPNDRPRSAPEKARQQVSNGMGRDHLDPTEPKNFSAASARNGSTSPSLHAKTDTSTDPAEDFKPEDVKEGVEEYEDDEDDEMLDPEDGASVPQTEAERRAERRKMKRFRLTHQQTRFLMSEFAKQAHPDAAHRERLSREIPGLSPRQVQVWFQNRRAKIKRLTADDRERMMKMRTVPDDFDNLQALHSPYGAIQGIATPLQSPADFTSPYGEHALMQPLMVDTMRRQENEKQHMASTGLSPAFGHVGFPAASSIGATDTLSPLSMSSNDRYYGSHLSSPLSGGPRSANPFNRPAGSNGYQMHSQTKTPRPLQPLQLRETMSRNRSQSLQSPLRSAVSWKSETLDYGEYLGGSTSPNLAARPQSHHQLDQPGGNSLNAHHFDIANMYSNLNAHTSPTRVAYPTSQPGQQQSSVRAESRFNSSSGAFTSGLDQRAQYRNQTSQQLNSHSVPPSTVRETFHSTFAVSSSGFPSAPLSAPSDFQLPRAPIDIGSRDYHLSQMSASMAPQHDFTSAYDHIISPVRTSQAERALHIEQPQRSPGGNIRDQLADAGFLGPDDFGIGQGHKRKRTISMPVAFKGL